MLGRDLNPNSLTVGLSFTSELNSSVDSFVNAQVAQSEALALTPPNFSLSFWEQLACLRQGSSNDSCLEVLTPFDLPKAVTAVRHLSGLCQGTLKVISRLQVRD